MYFGGTKANTAARNTSNSATFSVACRQNVKLQKNIIEETWSDKIQGSNYALVIIWTMALNKIKINNSYDPQSLFSLYVLFEFLYFWNWFLFTFTLQVDLYLE